MKFGKKPPDLAKNVSKGMKWFKNIYLCCLSSFVVLVVCLYYFRLQSLVGLPSNANKAIKLQENEGDESCIGGGNR